MRSIPSVFLTRAATLHLGLGFTLAALALWAKGGGGSSSLLLLRESHLHTLLVGWLIQFAVGVGFSIFPRLPDGSAGRWAKLVWVAAGLINIGVILGTLAPFVGAQAGLLAALATMLELAALALFIALLWPRIRTVNPTWPTNLPVARGRQPPPP